VPILAMPQHICILLHTRMDRRAAVANYLARGVSQAELARRARVSQATVSRTLNDTPRRHGEARRRLFKYIHDQQGGGLDQTLTDAVAATWDGSPEHARALASLISASGELWPRLGRDQRHDDE
jgi:transcriptional regulator with XRE-family HTH domain